MKKSMRCDCGVAQGSRREALMWLAALGVGTEPARAWCSSSSRTRTGSRPPVDMTWVQAVGRSGFGRPNDGHQEHENERRKL
ncbi:hypothetical protein [Piscinibacter sp.]|uniref:hypothetical protein n=1 Tax=Piscinibacter sp. TaxID=1903157 RepID=UPI002BD0FA2D|nr:hypothetical protein [Albitalea sp.]HUG22310.1 hypothetical protein [Albitalea sp.]